MEWVGGDLGEGQAARFCSLGGRRSEVSWLIQCHTEGSLEVVIKLGAGRRASGWEGPRRAYGFQLQGFSESDYLEGKWCLLGLCTFSSPHVPSWVGQTQACRNGNGAKASERHHRCGSDTVWKAVLG